MEAVVPSQHNEEEIVLRYFGSYVGSVLDVGANDGVTLSNTHELINRGWHGCLVEPSVAAFDRLRKLYRDRPDVHLFRYAIGRQDGEATFFESGTHLRRGDVSLISTINERELERWRRWDHRLRSWVKRVPYTFKKTVVEVRTFETFLASSPVKTFDMISIDAEGSDLDILMQMDLKALDCKLLIVEYNGHNLSSFLRNAPGYKLIARNRENLILAA